MNRHNADNSHEEQNRPQAPHVEPEVLDPYQTLGLTRLATLEEIKKAYFAKVREFPPEREPDKFKQIRSAYDALRTPEAKAATDLFLLHPPTPYQLPKRLPGFDLTFHAEDWYVLAAAYSDLGRVDFRDDFRDIDKLDK